MDAIRLRKTARGNQQDRKRNPKRYLLGVSYYGYILIGIFNGVYRTDDFRKTPSQIIHLL